MDRIIAVGVIVFVAWQMMGGQIPSPPDPGPEPTPNVRVDESKVWDEFADWVENNPAGSVNDTDHVLKMAQSLKDGGVLSDISRLDEYASKFQNIDDSNRKQIANRIRGR